MRFAILHITLVFAISSCFKNQQNPVPNIPFDVTIDINLPSYNSLLGVGGWCYIEGYGSRGLIVYRKSVDEFMAFDRHSPNDLEGNCFLPLFPDSENFLVLNDTCSSATFSLYDGSPLSNADIGLRQYQTLFDGINSLRIRN